MPLVLKSSELVSLIDMDKAIELIEEVVLEMTRDEVSVHAPYHLPVEGGALRVVSAALRGSARMGLRFGPALALTPPSGLRDHVCTLYGTDGQILAVMGYPYSTLRTGATVAVAVKHMAPAGATKVGLLGTGMNAISLLQGVMAVRDVAEVVVYSRNEERRAKFAEEASGATGLAIRAVGETRDAVTGQDIVLTATNFRQPLFPPDWLEPECHVNSMGPIGEIAAEVFLAASHVVVSCIEHERNYLYPTTPFPLVELIRDGKMSWDDVDELGAVVAGEAKARRRENGITLFHESAGGFGDIAFAGYAYEQALRLGLGQEVSME